MSFRLSTKLLVLTGLLCTQLFAQNVDEIIEKNIEARGGYARIKAVNTMQATIKLNQQGMKMAATLTQKRPNKLHLKAAIQGQTMVMSYDGEMAWWIFPFMGNPDPQKMPEDQAKDFTNDADIDGPLVDYKEKGHKIELVGKEDMEGTDVYRLKVTLKNGDVRHIFIDAEYYLELKQIIKTKVQGNEVEAETFLSDYKEVDGLMVPFSIETKVNGQTQMHIVIDKIELNGKIKDELFKMPGT